jgi:hypothetical protein
MLRDSRAGSGGSDLACRPDLNVLLSAHKYFCEQARDHKEKVERDAWQRFQVMPYRRLIDTAQHCSLPHGVPTECRGDRRETE